MKILIYFIIVLGILEIISNLYHFFKGNKKSIGLSAKKQHQELSLELDYKHFYIKAIIMFVFGVLFTLSGLMALQNLNNTFFTIILGLFAIYGIVQAFYYKRPYKVWMSLLVYILPFILLLLLSGSSEAATYHFIENDSVKCQFVFPFLLGTEPIKRLVVIDFKDDPEYEMMEPQYFSDSVLGTGLRVLLYRKDKKVDVYYQPGIIFDSSAFALGKGLGCAVETQMFTDRFIVTEAGIDIDIAFTDYKGRKIELYIKENSKPKKSFSFLAPVGNDIEHPAKLFLAYMHKFDFVTRDNTVIRAQLGERKLLPANFPIKRNGKKVYFARYASSITIGEINATTSSVLVFDKTNDSIKTGKHNFIFTKDKKIISYWIESDKEKVEMKFKNGIPNLLTLAENDMVKGPWEYLVSGTKITGGNFTLLRNADRVSVELDVCQKWKPEKLPFSFRVFTFLKGSFRTWPTTYKWVGLVNLNDMSIQAKWQRK